jgi:hypothetical protein
LSYDAHKFDLENNMRIIQPILGNAMKKQALILICAGLFASNLQAMQLNIDLSNNLKANNTPVNLTWKICQVAGPGPFDRKCNSMTLRNVSPDKIGYITSTFASDHPVDDADGSHSNISLGYKKGNLDVSPATCQNIKLMEITLISFNEDGCTINQ